MPVLSIGTKPDFTMFRDAVAVYHQVVVSVRHKGQSEEQVKEQQRPFRSLSLFNLARHARQVVDGYSENRTPKLEWALGVDLLGGVTIGNIEIKIRVLVPGDLDVELRETVFTNFMAFFQ
jgi:hypothetical protein